MEIVICLDKEDIVTQQFGLNYHIAGNGVKISLTKEAAIELLSDLQSLLSEIGEKRTGYIDYTNDKLAEE